jgi:hypothetical protein
LNIHLHRLAANWRVIVAVASLVSFALAGTAGDPVGYG